MTRRRPAGVLRTPQTPMEQVALDQEQEVASEVTRIMEAIRDYDQDKVRASVYVKAGNGIGPWQWAADVGLPPDFPRMMNEMRERFGAGDYELRVMALGKLRACSPFSIAKERTPAPGAPPPQAPAQMGMSDIMSLILAQQAESRREAADQRRDMAEAAQRSQALLIGMVTAVAPALIPVLAGGQKSNSTADLVALVTAMQASKGERTSLKDMVETLAVLKTLTEPGGGGGDKGEDGGDGFNLAEILSDGRRLVGPAVKAVADLVSARQANGAQPNGQAPAQLAGGGQLSLAAPGAPASRYPVLDLVRTDVVYFFQRGFDPEKAADMVYDVIDANIEAGVITPGQINEIAATFALSPTGLQDLAAEGIDLTTRPDWAAEFFQHLATIHNEATSDLGGVEGSAPDTPADGAASAPG